MNDDFACINLAFYILEVTVKKANNTLHEITYAIAYDVFATIIMQL